MLRYLPIMLSASLAMSCGCGSEAQHHAGSGSGWVEHKDPAGFAVQYPQGWTAAGSKDGHVLIHSSDKSAFAVVQPFQAPDGGSSAEWIGPLVKHMSALFPDADITHNAQINAQPDQAVAKVAYTANGRAGRANVL